MVTTFLPDYPQARIRMLRNLAKFKFKIIPGLMDDVGELRHDANKALKDPALDQPHIPNALINVPSQDLPRQRAMQDKMNTAMQDMHNQMVEDISKFVDDQKNQDQDWRNRITNINWIASDMSDRVVDHAVLAYDQDNLTALIKLLSFFAIASNKGEVAPALVSKVAGWYQQAEVLFDDIKLAKRSYRLFNPGTYNFNAGRKITTDKLEKLREAMKTGRKALREKERGFATSTAYTRQMKGMLNNLFSYFFSSSENAFNNLSANIHHLNDPDLNQLLAPAHKGDPATDLKELRRLVKRHGGEGFSLDPEQSQALRDKSEEHHKEYRNAYNKVTAHRRREMQLIIRGSGKERMKASDLKKALEKAGMPTGFIPTGFDDGLYDQDGNMFTPNGVPFDKNVVGGWLRWNPGATGDDNKALAQYQNPNMEKPAGIYSMSHARGGLQDKKYAATDTNVENIVQHQNRWTGDTKSRDPVKQMLGNMAQVLYYTAIRVSSRIGRTDNKPTYGLTTLTAGHVKKQGDNLVLDFIGKSGVHQKLRIEPRDNVRVRLINYIWGLTEGKKRSDPIWVPKGSNRAISANDVNDYLKEIGWAGTAKTFRTVRGSMRMEDELENEPESFRRPANAEAYIKEKLLKVGRDLGHKKMNSDGTEEDVWQTAAKSYVNPQIILDFLHRHNVRPLPRWAEQLVKIHEQQDAGSGD